MIILFHLAALCSKPLLATRDSLWILEGLPSQDPPELPSRFPADFQIHPTGTPRGPRPGLWPGGGHWPLGCPPSDETRRGCVLCRPPAGRRRRAGIFRISRGLLRDLRPRKILHCKPRGDPRIGQDYLQGDPRIGQGSCFSSLGVARFHTSQLHS